MSSNSLSAGPHITNSFDAAGTLNSVLPREGVDIGPAPDFWADFDEALKRFPPKQQAAQQQQRASAPMQAAALRSAPAQQERVVNYNDQFKGPGRVQMHTKMIGGPQIVPGRVAAAPWDPGANFSGFAPPGYNPYPESSTFAGPQGGALTGPGISGGDPRQGRAPAGPIDPFPHGTGQAFEASRMEDARQRSDAEYYGRPRRS